MIAVFIVLTIIILLVLLYLFVFTRPCKNKPYNKILLRDYAHRGLHGEKVPENSLSAFELACRNNFGIELDVQLSNDDTVMVFHDYSLLRMTGTDCKLSSLDYSKLSQMELLNTKETIPSFKEVLELVNRRVPLLVELKGESLDASLCPKVAELLKEYKGEYCIESFNPFLIREMRKYLPNAFYGQLYTNVCRDKKKYSILNILLTGMVFNFLSRPDFIAYNKLDRNSPVVRFITKVYRIPKFVWTAKGKSEIEDAHTYSEYAIFEMK